MKESDAGQDEENEIRADEAESAAYDEGRAALEDRTADAVEMDVAYEEEFRSKVAGWGLRYFAFSELLFLGGSHSSPGSSCKGLNSLPPKQLWDNFERTAKVLDELRERLGAPIRLTSIFRNEAYNGCLSGTATKSQHKSMRAADFTAQDGQGPAHWRSVLLELRDQNLFRGGVGIYNTFIHLDTRGENKNWDNRA